VTVDGKIIYSDTNCGRLQTPHQAETMALFMLLNYIKDFIEHGSKVEVFGDDKTLIDKVVCSGNKKFENLEIRLLYEVLKPNYSLSLTHIPGKENKTAHNLSRIIYNTKSNLTNINTILKREGICIEREYMSIDDIFIPGYIKHCILPSPKNYTKRVRHCQKYGHDHKSKIISINSNGQMIAGYTTYLVLKDSGTKSCYVNVWKEGMEIIAA